MPELSRRGFLRDSVLAAMMMGAAGGAVVDRVCGVACADEELAVEAPSRVLFGFSLYGMRSLPVADGLRACAEIGYDTVELVANAEWPCDPAGLSRDERKAIVRELREQKLGLSALMENLVLLGDEARHRQNLDRLRAAAELGHELSPDAPPVVETILGGRPADWERDREAMARRLQDWGKVGEATRTVIAVKPHVGGTLHTAEGAAWLMRAVDHRWIRLVYDFSHYRLRGLPLAGTMQQLIGRTAFVHVKDARGDAEKFEFLLPGEGDTDYGQYCALLKRSRYSGAVVVEVSGLLSRKPGYDPRAAARTSYEKLAPVFERAGLRG